MATKVKELRLAKELTGEQMAEKLGISSASYSKKENGLIRFSLREANILSKEFGMSITDIFFADELSKNESC